ncbi:MAG: arginine--tRNA ligase [Syntrophales bacterium]|jgi:arginyl-tRNA synthetase
MMKQQIIQFIEASIQRAEQKGSIDTIDLPFIEVEVSRDAAHGDYASNVAMILAARLKRKPRDIAGILVDEMKGHDHIVEKVEIAGPGFINFFIRERVWANMLERVDSLGDQYGKVLVGDKRRVQVEFVSANPTGPLHIGHARGAVIGDVLSNVLRAAGYAVSKEYYINDAGNQMYNLGKSVYYRYLDLLGDHADFPDTCYQGEYIRNLAAEIIRDSGGRYRLRPPQDVIQEFTTYAAESILKEIQEDLAAFGVIFDEYFSEKKLYDQGVVAKVLTDLEEKGFIYQEGSTLWFRTTDFGDEKNRVVVRQNGEPTYFAADIAYHKNKFERDFETVIDIWGADHHGYIPRMHAGIQALGYPKEALQIILVQLVSLLRDGKPVAMSTRAGEFVTLREVVDEVGKDAARYNFMMRRSDSPLDFDLEVAKRQSMDNPVYYVQYAHARICSIFRMAEEKGLTIPSFMDIDVDLLNLPEEVGLIKSITRFPELVEGSAKALEPHRLTFYLNNLAGTFHSYYNKLKVISDDMALSRARLLLMKAVRIVLRNALSLLGVSAPEQM